MAGPTFRASGAWNVNTTSPLAATLPTHATGDLLICEVHSSSSSTTIGTHAVSGWTLIGTFPNTAGTRRGRVSVYALRATSGAMSNPSATFSTTGTTYQNRVRAHSITAGTWQDDGTLANAWEDVTNKEASDSSTLAFSGLVPTGDNSLCVASVCQHDDTATAISWSNSYATQGANSDSATGSDGFSSTGFRALATAGACDTTAPFTGGGSVTTIGIECAVRNTSVRTGTATSLTGTGAHSTATGTKKVSATVASLTGTGTHGTAAGTKKEGAPWLSRLFRREN